MMIKKKNANNYNNYLEFMEVKVGRTDFYQEEKIKKSEKTSKMLRSSLMFLFFL